MTLDEAYERVGWAELGQTYIHHTQCDACGGRMSAGDMMVIDGGKVIHSEGCPQPRHHKWWERETGGIGDVLAPLLADALKDETISAELSLLLADTLRDPAVDSALNRIGLRLAAWTAGGIVVGLLAGYYLRRRF